MEGGLVALAAADQPVGLPDLHGRMGLQKTIGMFDGFGVIREAAVDRATNPAIGRQVLEPVGAVAHGRSSVRPVSFWTARPRREHLRFPPRKSFFTRILQPSASD
jgi:hypothetical protein